MRLHQRAQACSRSGDDDAALALYAKCLRIEPDRATTLYNVGLVHKYRGEWQLSFEFNAKARVLAPRDEATLWNLAIAATALRRWSVAREAWRDVGIDISAGDGPIDMDFGVTPIRLHPNANGEVVWARRIDPVRACITSIPFPESGFRLKDVVLHDGAATGTRTVEGREFPVFNVLETFERSAFETYVIHLHSATDERVAWLQQQAGDAGVGMEDWTTNVRALCKQCSEGRPHETHDHGPSAQDMRRIGLASSDPAKIEALVAACTASGQMDVEQVDLAQHG